MTAPNSEHPSPHGPIPDWEAFYRNYRKPGYVPGFALGHKLGGGVFGVVFKAQKESIGKAYAIKFLRVEDPGVREQVVRELDQVGLFAQVDHPNLVSIEDKGVVDGLPYIVMGYAGDETLKSRLEERRLDEEEALRVFVQIARGVQALHEHSLVHFDLKPANVFLKGDVARVGDYGLSKLVTETAMSLTTGRGTPYYMAPEMLRRKGDHRSDIYSLGVILYECLAGEVPFKGDSEWEVLKAHEEQAVTFPDDFSRRYRPLVSRMLAKDPDARYQSVAELLADLRAPAGLGESVMLELGGAPAIAPTPPGLAHAAAEHARREAARAVADAERHAQRARRQSTWVPWAVLAVLLAFASSVAGGMRGGVAWFQVAVLLGVAVGLILFFSHRRRMRQEWEREDAGVKLSRRRHTWDGGLVRVMLWPFGFVVSFVLALTLLWGVRVEEPEPARTSAIRIAAPPAPSAPQGPGETHIWKSIQQIDLQLGEIGDRRGVRMERERAFLRAKRAELEAALRTLQAQTRSRSR